MTDENITRQQYHDEISDIVDVIEDRLSEDPAAELSELVFEEIDSHEWVIYNHCHTEVLQYSDPEEWSHLVANDETDHHKVLQAMAFDAMRTDVWDEIHSRGLDS